MTDSREIIARAVGLGPAYWEAADLILSRLAAAGFEVRRAESVAPGIAGAVIITDDIKDTPPDLSEALSDEIVTHFNAEFHYTPGVGLHVLDDGQEVCWFNWEETKALARCLGEKTDG